MENIQAVTKGGNNELAEAAMGVWSRLYDKDPMRGIEEEVKLTTADFSEAHKRDAKGRINDALSRLKGGTLEPLTDVESMVDNDFARNISGQIARAFASKSQHPVAVLLRGYASGEFQAFAQGGIVRKPTLGLIGEAGPEAVIPLGRSGGVGQTNNFHFHGAVYGVEDLKEAVVEAVRDHAISGGFSGVFAEA